MRRRRGLRPRPRSLRDILPYLRLIPRVLLLTGLLTVGGAGVYLGCRHEPVPAVQEGASPAKEIELPSISSPTPTAPIRVHDGAETRSVVWARDEAQWVHAPGAEPPAGAFTKSEGEAGVKIAPARDRAAFVAWSREVLARGGAKEIRPVFYASAEALERRSLHDRLILTRQVAVTLPEGATPEAAAGRYGARVLSKLGSTPRTWLLETAGPFDALDVAAALREKDGAPYASPQFARVRDKKRRPRRLIPTDPMFAQQWHLRNTVQLGEDINVVNTWDTRRGSGVVIGIIDDGLMRTHEDLAANYSAALSVNFNGGNASDPTPSPGDDHGTSCAGLAGARQNNGVGVSGVAPEATLAGIRLTAAAVTPAQEVQAMAHQNGAIHVKSNSWGPADDGFTLERAPALVAAEIETAATTGRGGRGVVFTWAGGNGWFNDDNSNFDGYANSRHVIGVAALIRSGNAAGYSEEGANLLIAAPGGQDDIVTTDRADYATNFDGTSAATPIVAGVAALMLERRPALTARDVMHVLVRSARKNNPGQADWIDNAAGFHHNHNYGFGALDAGAAVDLAGRWPLVAAVASRSAPSGALSQAIPNGSGMTTHVLSISGTPFRVEHVEVDFNATHEKRGDIEVALVAPSGTRAVLAQARPDDSPDGFSNWTFLSRRTWGEMAVGDWTLQVSDPVPGGDTGTFTGWTLRVYGTPVDATPPGAGAVNDGAGADVDNQSSATTVSANWSGFAETAGGVVFEWAVGTTPGGEELQTYTQVGDATSASQGGFALASGTPYYVSVRATNVEGLSTIATSDGFQVDDQPPTAPGTPAASPAVSATGQFSVSWTAASDPGGSPVAGYTLMASNGGAFSDLATGLTGLSANVDVSAGGPGTYVFRVKAVDGVGNVGPDSPSSAGVVFDPTAPLVSIGGPDPAATSTTPFALGGTASDNQGIAALTWVNSATGLGGAATGTAPWSASVALKPGANLITVFAFDAAGNVSTDSLTVNYTPADALPPSLTINGAASVSTSANPFSMQGAALDNVGVSSIAWENVSTGARGAIAPLAAWTVNNVLLLSGTNVLVVTARDAAGNEASDTLTVAFTPAAVDLTLPGVAIGTPNTDPFATGSSPLALQGTASDDTQLAVIRWSNAATGGGGAADGTAIWTASPALRSGANLITVTAVDASGNEASDMVTVNFTPGGADAIAPFVQILSPTAGASFSTSAPSALIAGLASDDQPALEVVWSNAETGQSGTAFGAGAWSASIPLQAGVNTITMTAIDGAGNVRTDVLTVTKTSGGGGGGGGGGCGLTGLEVLLLLAFRRRR